MKIHSMILFLIGLLLFTHGHARAADLSDIEHHRSCKLCGMNRRTYSYSRVLMEYDNGPAQGFCSLHCAAAELAVSIDRSPKAIKVADFESKQLVNAESAAWVVGGRLRGVMMMQGKWAFLSRERAEAFSQKNGGTIASFDLAIRLAYQDMYDDTRALRNRKQASSARSNK